MRDGRITHAFLTPSVLTTMSPADVPELEALVIGGEHPNAEVVRTWSTGGPRLFNAYGPHRDDGRRSGVGADRPPTTRR